MYSGPVEALLAAIQELSRLKELPDVMAAVERAARALTGADGVTFVLREGENVFYAHEDAIGPLWKGRRFPAKDCVSGWAMAHRESVVIEDIFADQRVPLDAYRPTFVKSLAMVPIRKEDPIGAIGAYWATRRMPTAAEVERLECLAASAAVAVANAELLRDLQRREDDLKVALVSEQAARAQAETALQQRDEFLSIASHELRTPLTSLQLDVAMFTRARREQVGEAERQRLSRMEGQVQKLDNLIEQLLDVSRIMLRRLNIEPGAVDGAEVVAAVVDRFQELARVAPASAITLVGEGPAPGHWDRARLEQVLAILLSNALKYGGAEPVTVRFAADPRTLRIEVRDAGIGIPPADQPRIFDRFFRGAPASNLPGLGLGLWIAREIVTAHGGTISVESAVGQGSTFRLELPRELGALPTRPLAS